MSEQKNHLYKEFIKHLFGHGGLYTDVFKIEPVQITEGIMSHLLPPHQIHRVLMAMKVHKEFATASQNNLLVHEHFFNF